MGLRGILARLREAERGRAAELNKPAPKPHMQMDRSVLFSKITDMIGRIRGFSDRTLETRAFYTESFVLSDQVPGKCI